ncbi:hypothetical protein BJ508DRAFT_146655 [Ascobolus immersus RN42]|uniref:Uncharacterized protein n=1 Tax=Ascobolus immersus RN42 TaxID=1160509 RepID=A0A3N4IJY2_ASCIM|nr:hypothetical protein BJ508DRAFT_146655 [Ascobolus immersus RN42]
MNGVFWGTLCLIVEGSRKFCDVLLKILWDSFFFMYGCEERATSSRFDWMPANGLLDTAASGIIKSGDQSCERHSKKSTTFDVFSRNLQAVWKLAFVFGGAEFWGYVSIHSGAVLRGGVLTWYLVASRSPKYVEMVSLSVEQEFKSVTTSTYEYI